MALTQEQIQAGFSTVEGPYDPITGKLKITPLSQTGGTIPSPVKIRRYQDEAQSFLEGLPRSVSPSDEANIRAKRFQGAQTAIDAINASMNRLIEEERAMGLQRTGRVRAIESSAGLAGSPRGEAQRTEVEKFNAEAMKALENERTAKISQILLDVENRAGEEIEAKRLEAAGNAEAYVNFLQGSQTQAKADIKELAGLGVKLEQLAPEDIRDLITHSGYDDLTFKTLWNANLPKAAKIDYKTEKVGNSILFYGVDPQTGKLVTEKYDLEKSLKSNEEFKEIDGVPYAMSRDDNGQLSLRPIKGFTAKPKKAEKDELDELLSVEDAAKLGLPFGSTKGQAAGKIPKKPLGNTQLDNLSQARIVKSDMERIGELVDELGAQGPVLGRVRKLNPYDSRVVELNQLITQAVPSLARGIFKEVGVLTDQDVNRYTQTMANEKLTKEQARTATENLLNKINRSIDLQLDTFDKGGKDVREFEDLRTSSVSVEDLAEEAGFDASEVQELRDQGYSDDDIREIINA